MRNPWPVSTCDLRSQQGQCRGLSVSRGYQEFPKSFSDCNYPIRLSTPGDTAIETRTLVLMMSGHCNMPASSLAYLILEPSPLRPGCPAAQRIFQWKGVNSPPPSTLQIPVLEDLALRAVEHSLRDTGGYGSALRKFHIFCNIFSVPESDRLPAAFPLLHSFALWAAADPTACGMEGLIDGEATHFEPVSPSTVRKYLAGVRAWHIAQG